MDERRPLGWSWQIGRGCVGGDGKGRVDGFAFLHSASFGWETVEYSSDGDGLLDQPLQRGNLAAEVVLSGERALAAAAVLEVADVLTHACRLWRRVGNTGWRVRAHTLAVDTPATALGPRHRHASGARWERRWAILGLRWPVLI